MGIVINKIRKEVGEVNVINNNMIELKAIDAKMEINPDGSPTFAYYTGISLQMEPGTVGIIISEDSVSTKSLYLAGGIQFLLPDNKNEIVCKFKLNTNSVPNLYEKDSVVARLFIIGTQEFSLIQTVHEEEKVEKTEEDEHK